jgi:hypothetical protein
MGRLPETEPQERLDRAQEREHQEGIQAEIAEDSVERIHTVRLADECYRQMTVRDARLARRPELRAQSRRVPISS